MVEIVQRPRVIVFAKAPAPGRVKTRLIPVLGAERAAELQRVFVLDVIERLAPLGDRIRVELHTDQPTDAWNELKIPGGLQSGGDLGARLRHAIAAALEEGSSQVVILGGDAPTLPVSHLAALLDSPADVALGPAEDGGYWGIGCRRWHERMFDGVVWSDPRTLGQTRHAAEACGLSVDVGPTWYDVDSIADLERLAACPNLPDHTARWFRRYRR